MKSCPTASAIFQKKKFWDANCHPFFLFQILKTLKFFATKTYFAFNLELLSLKGRKIYEHFDNFGSFWPAFTRFPHFFLFAITECPWVRKCQPFTHIQIDTEVTPIRPLQMMPNFWKYFAPFEKKIDIVVMTQSPITFRLPGSR